MYSFLNLEPVHFPMSGSNCCFLTCIHICQEAGQVVWYSHLLKSFPQFFVIHTVKGFRVINKAEVDALLELSCFSNNPMDVGNLISGYSAFSKSSLNIWKFLFTYCWTLTWRILNITLLGYEMSAIVRQIEPSLALPFFANWNENWPFPVRWPLLSFLNLLAYWVKHFHSIIF